MRTRIGVVATSVAVCALLTTTDLPAFARGGGFGVVVVVFTVVAVVFTVVVWRFSRRRLWRRWRWFSRWRLARPWWSFRRLRRHPPRRLWWDGRLGWVTYVAWFRRSWLPAGFAGHGFAGHGFAGHGFAGHGVRWSWLRRSWLRWSWLRRSWRPGRPTHLRAAARHMVQPAARSRRRGGAWFCSARRTGRRRGRRWRCRRHRRP